MRQATTISEALLPRVPEGLYSLVASICETADHAAGDPDREIDPSAYREIRRRLEGLRARTPPPSESTWSGTARRCSLRSRRCFR